MLPQSANLGLSVGTPSSWQTFRPRTSDSDESLLAVPHTGSADEQHRKPADRTADKQPLTIRHSARQRQRRHRHIRIGEFGDIRRLIIINSLAVVAVVAVAVTSTLLIIKVDISSPAIPPIAKIFFIVFMKSPPIFPFRTLLSGIIA